MEKNKNKVTFKGDPVTLLGNEIQPGDEAPDFTVLNNELKPTKLSDYGGKVRVLSVFLSIDTGPCSRQTKKFEDEASKLGDDVVIMTISNDLPFALNRYCNAEGIKNLITLSDHKDLDFSTKYGFLMEEFRMLARGVVVVDRNNKVVYTEYVPEVSEEPDYESAIEAIKKVV